jgi:hypothetical protein
VSTQTAASNVKVSAREYSEAVEAAEIINIRLIKSEFVVEPEALSRERSQWKQNYDFQVRDIAFDATRSLLTGLVVGEAVCRVGRKRILGLKCRYLVAYAVSGSPTEAAAETFVRRVAAFAAYPYFRSHFADVCSQSGIVLPPLPIMKEPKRQIPRQE